MPCTIIFYHDTPGESLTLTLRNHAGEIVNSGETSFTEDTGLRYVSEIAQSLDGWYVAQIYDADSDLIYTGSVKVADDDGAYLIDDPQDMMVTVPTVSEIREEIDSNSTKLANLDATVSSRLAPSTAGRSLSVNADGSIDATAVIDSESLSQAIGEAISDGIAVVVSSFQSSALAQLAGTRVINVAIPALSGQQLSHPLIQGDSYSAALNSAIEFSRSDFPDLPEGVSAKLSAVKREAGQETRFEISGDQASVPVRAGAKVVRFEPTAEQTRLWEPGKYEFDVQLTWPDGNTRTFVGPNVFLRVLAEVTET